MKNILAHNCLNDKTSFFQVQSFVVLLIIDNNFSMNRAFETEQ